MNFKYTFFVGFLIISLNVNAQSIRFENKQPIWSFDFIDSQYEFSNNFFGQGKIRFEENNVNILRQHFGNYFDSYLFQSRSMHNGSLNWEFNSVYEPDQPRAYCENFYFSGEGIELPVYIEDTENDTLPFSFWLSSSLNNLTLDKQTGFIIRSEQFNSQDSNAINVPIPTNPFFTSSTSYFFDDFKFTQFQYLLKSDESEFFLELILNSISRVGNLTSSDTINYSLKYSPSEVSIIENEKDYLILSVLGYDNELSPTDFEYFTLKVDLLNFNVEPFIDFGKDLPLAFNYSLQQFDSTGIIIYSSSLLSGEEDILTIYDAMNNTVTSTELRDSNGSQLDFGAGLLYSNSRTEGIMFLENTSSEIDDKNQINIYQRVENEWDLKSSLILDQAIDSILLGRSSVVDDKLFLTLINVIKEDASNDRFGITTHSLFSLEDLDLLTSVNDVNSKQDLSFFPNPAKNKIYVPESYIGHNYQLIDLFGRVSLSGKFASREEYFSVTTGLYSICIEQSTGIKCSKIAVQN